MSEIRFDRLAQLADHLESGKLGHDKFDFSCYHETWMPCGTAGCAIGECPFVWPDDWHFTPITTSVTTPILSSSEFSGVTTQESGMEWFGLQHEYQYEHLFFPMQQQPEIFGGNWLPVDATRDAVAANIRAFIAKMQGVPS